MPEKQSSPAHGEHSLEHLRKAGEYNVERLGAAATLLLDHIRAGGLVHTAGAGHSLAGVLETFYRAGGLAAIRPLYHPDLLPLHGVAAGTAAERGHGTADEILADSGFRGRRDLLVVFSNSGINPYPVELAALARRAGSPVIAVTSPAAGVSAAKRATGILADQADIVLDTLVPAGDVSYPPETPVTAPLSSLANTYLWNLLLVRLYDAATSANIALPLWRSANTQGGDAANAGNLEYYRSYVPALR